MYGRSSSKVVFTSLVLVALLSTVILTGVVAGAQSEEDGSLIISAHTVTGNQGFPKEKVCVLKNRFQPSQMVVWRVKVYDPKTSEPMGSKELSYVKIKLPDGQSFSARYGGHPPDDPKDYYWTATWQIPPVYPTGSLPYTIEAKANDGRTGKFTEFEVKPSLLTIVPREEG